MVGWDYSKNIGLICLTPIFLAVGIGLLGVGIERASLCLLGAGIWRVSSLTRTKFSSSLSVSPDNNLLISSLRRLIILLLYIIFFISALIFCILE